MIVSTLLSQTVAFWKKHLLVLLAGAVVFGILQSVLMSMFITPHTARMDTWAQQMEKRGAMMEGMMKDLAKVQDGDTDAMREFAEQGEEKAAEMEAMAKDMALGGMMGVGAAGGMLAGMFTSILLSIIVGIISTAYYMTVAIKAPQDIGSAVGLTIKNFVPWLALSIWSGLRSFAWIPLVGIIGMVYYFPRFILAPLYLLEQGKGPMESVALSMKGTEGKWIQIVLHAVVVMILCWISYIVAAFVLSIIPFALPIAHGIISAFCGVYSVFLARAVMAGQLK